MAAASLLLFLFLAVLGGVSLSALRNRTLAKMGLRNLKRRKTNTVIVVLGLMIGTAIISGSLVTQDTLENMFTKYVYEAFDETDETVFAVDGQGNYASLGYDNYTALNDYIAADPALTGLVEETSPELHLFGSAFAPRTRLSQPQVRLTGYDYNESVHFGKVKTREGELVSGAGLALNEALVSNLLADELNLKEGDTLQVFYPFVAGDTFNFTVKHILAEPADLSVFP